MKLEQLLKDFRGGKLNLDETIAQIKAVEPLGFAQLDLSRKERTGFAEVIYGPGKTALQLQAIFEHFQKIGERCLATRVEPTKALQLCQKNSSLTYNEAAETLFGDWSSAEPLGKLAVLSAGTSDLKVVEEVAAVAQFLGVQVTRFEDVGVAGVHRLFHELDRIKQADVLVVVAGMDGALPSLVGGLVAQPIIAVPTSVGYGAGFEGLAPLLTMLNACAAGISVVNIDNGFGAAMAAAKILLGFKRAS